jgi:hypothetical protein
MRQRDQHEISAVARRELEALDRALAGEAVESDLEAVAELARQLRAARPQTPAGFATALDQRAASGFAAGESRSALVGLRHRLVGIPARRLLAPAAALATLAVVISVAVIQSSGPGDDPTRPSGIGTEAPQATPSPEGEGKGSAPKRGEALGGATPAAEPDLAVPPDDPGLPRDRLAPGQRQRAVERSAHVALSADADEFAEVSDGVVEVADRHRGIVLSASQSSSEETSQASFELAIPSGKLQQALADLSDLGHVESRSENSLDVTASVVGARARLADARSEVASLRRQLAGATTPRATDRIRERLRQARERAAEARTAVRRLDQRTRFATVAVTVSSDGSGDGEWGVSDALDDIAGAISTAAGVALISIAILLPLALLAALAAAVSRAAARRGRERALDREPSP